MLDPVLFHFIEKLTVPSTDDGKLFIHTERRDRITESLRISPYTGWGDFPLASLYRHRDYREERPAILLSTHIDSVYHRYYCLCYDKEIHGTFDNSVTNAIALYLMLQNRLHPQVLVAFTGNEEHDSRGASQIMEFLRQPDFLFVNMEMVITMDLTGEYFEKAGFTIENMYIKRNPPFSRLTFSNRREMKEYFRRLCREDAIHCLPDAEPDESWTYKQYDVNGFSFCLPGGLIGRSMHSGKGVRILSSAAARYTAALESFTGALLDQLINNPIR
ncbi:MAG: M28 family peptidase [bacterium]